MLCGVWLPEHSAIDIRMSVGSMVPNGMAGAPWGSSSSRATISERHRYSASVTAQAHEAGAARAAGLGAEGPIELRPSHITVMPMISRRRFTEITGLRLELAVKATEIAVRQLAPNLLGALKALEYRAKTPCQQHVIAKLSAGNGSRSHMIQLPLDTERSADRARAGSIA